VSELLKRHNGVGRCPLLPLKHKFTTAAGTC